MLFTVDSIVNAASLMIVRAVRSVKSRVAVAVVVVGRGHSHAWTLKPCERMKGKRKRKIIIGKH